jgi:tetratricopeptide (TPR) repeat protein
MMDIDVSSADREQFAKLRVAALTSLCRLLNRRGALLEADSVLEEARTVAAEYRLSGERVQVGLYKGSAQLSAQFDRWDEAATAYDSLHAVYLRANGPRSGSTLYYAGVWAFALAQSGRVDEALNILGPAISVCEADSLLATTLYRLILYRGDVERLRGRWDAATRDYEQAHAAFERIHRGELGLWPGRSAYRLGLACRQRGDLAAAEAYFERAYANLYEELGARGPELCEVAHAWADVLLQRREFAQAELIALASYATQSASFGSNSAQARRSAQLVDRIYEDWSRPEDLRKWRSRQASLSVAPVLQAPQTNKEMP